MASHKHSCIYFAGFFDGEGSCGIYDAKKRKQTQFRVSLCQNDPRPLTQAHVKWGGSVRARRRPYKGRVVVNYEWYIYGAKAERFLQDILPFTCVKTAQIEVFLKARTIVGKQGHRITTQASSAVKEAEDILKGLKKSALA